VVEAWYFYATAWEANPAVANYGLDLLGRQVGRGLSPASKQSEGGMPSGMAPPLRSG
jgi:hypothetical protein